MKQLYLATATHRSNSVKSTYIMQNPKQNMCQD